MDLSFPKNQSVNAFVECDSYLGTDFVLTLPSIDNVVQSVIKLGRGSHLFKIDVARVFRHIKVDPGDFKFLGLYHEGYYYDTSLAFGFRHGSTFFTRLSDSIRYIMKSEGYQVVNYIDDVIGLGTPSVATKSYHRLISLMEELGLDINSSKNTPPSTLVTCLGIDINTITFTLSLT